MVSAAATYKGRLAKAVMLACVATVLGAIYALDATHTLRGRRSDYESSVNNFAAYRNKDFVYYVRRHEAHSFRPSASGSGICQFGPAPCSRLWNRSVEPLVVTRMLPVAP